MKPIDRLLDIMSQLRDPVHGCPWDLKQTFSTIVPYTLEEAYEVAEAITRGDMAELRDELGDLLFQVVFYARLAHEQGDFDFDDVAAGICDKMLRRHPHVFADTTYQDDAQLRDAWERTKREERAARGSVTNPVSQLDGIALALPALVRAEKLQRRAARVGFDWPDVSGAFDKVREELDEVEAAVTEGNPKDIEEELGDLLFAMVNVTRWLGVDAEQALRHAGTKFERRFRMMEELVRTCHKEELGQLGLAALDTVWDEVKSKEKLL